MSHPAQALHSESEGAHAERARLNEVVQHLREHLGDSLIAVVLFGSQARGEATPESDWDLLIVAEDLPARTLARYRTVKSFIPTYWRGRVSILAKTLSEFESALSPLYLDIALDGMVLYDPAGYMRRRLEQLRRLVRRLGLVRKKRGRDIVWGWKRPPRAGWMLRWDEATG